MNNDSIMRSYLPSQNANQQSPWSLLSSILNPPSSKPCQAQTKEFIPPIHGSARFAKFHEAKTHGLTEQGQGRTLAPYVGTIKENGYISCFIYGRPPSSNQELLPSTHLLTVAKTQAGKSSGQLAMNLLNYSGAVLVNDPKGELYQRTAGYRINILGHKVCRFAPEAEDSNVWNPISSIRTDLNVPYEKITYQQRATEEEDTKFLAEMLITQSGNPDDVFWEKISRLILAGILLYVATSEIFELCQEVQTDGDEQDIEQFELFKQCQVRERSMFEVTRLLFLPPKAFKKLLELMAESKRPLIQNSATQFMRLESGEGKISQSIFAMQIAHLDIWSSPRIKHITYKEPSAANRSKSIVNDFEFTDLADGKTTIYINFEPDLSDSQSVLRVLVGVAMRQLKQKNKPLASNPIDYNNPPVLFLLDEFATLGYMRPIEEALTYIAGYNVRFWFFVQDVCQLKQHYPKSWSTFFSNTATQCFYGINEIETAKLISEMLGVTTVENLAYNNGTSTGPANLNGGYPTKNHSSTTSHVQRPLMTPDEVQRASKDHVIILIHGMRPILAHSVKFFEWPEFVDRSRMSLITAEDCVTLDSGA